MSLVGDEGVLYRSQQWVVCGCIGCGVSMAGRGE